MTTVPRFDDLIHPGTRLTLVATLAAADWAEFSYLKETLGLSDSALSKQLSVLENAGYVATERRLDGSRHKVHARLTDAGRVAFDGHVAALRAIVDGAGRADQGLDDAGAGVSRRTAR
ncbi:winged helix-turn-helix domain-containing protein [Mycolicibacterium peregrinum]|uniref:MarR family transcriptional regulator n=1 Tax=Mycolicibacterium peregrinum TaxID=43304 RepID=A0A1A0W4D8_MYCPR|nr:transcriptional regulator [Mycolicibacterium peregrinum]OBB90609.1 MarR family transcriptional regulator [Mycolicibacterium peregrinum]